MDQIIFDIFLINLKKKKNPKVNWMHLMSIKWKKSSKLLYQFLGGTWIDTKVLIPSRSYNITSTEEVSLTTYVIYLRISYERKRDVIKHKFENKHQQLKGDDAKDYHKNTIDNMIIDYIIIIFIIVSSCFIFPSNAAIYLNFTMIFI